MHKNAFMHHLNQMSNKMDRVANDNKQDIDSDPATETTCMLDWNTTQVSTSADSSETTSDTEKLSKNSLFKSKGIIRYAFCFNHDFLMFPIFGLSLEKPRIKKQKTLPGEKTAPCSYNHDLKISI